MKLLLLRLLRDALRAIGAPESVPIVLEHPKAPHPGDVATPVAFALAPIMGRQPAALAHTIAERLRLNTPADTGCVPLGDIGVSNGFVHVTFSPDIILHRLSELIGSDIPANVSLPPLPQLPDSILFPLATARGILRHADSLGIVAPPGTSLAPLVLPQELAVARALIDLAEQGTSTETLRELAEALADFMRTCRVVACASPLREARLQLLAAVPIVSVV